MTRIRRTLVLLLLSSSVSCLWGLAILRATGYRMLDFKGVYFSARCLLEHGDPYKESETLRVYQLGQGQLPSSPGERYLLHQVMQVQYFPTALLCVVPFAMLPWEVAGVLWTITTVTILTFAAILVSDAAGRYAPVVSIALTCIVLANIESIVESGNPAGIAVGLCVIAVYCLLRERFGWVGVLCLAVSLCLKPHVTGLVWLYFLLAGGTYRRRALQVLLVVVALGLPAILLVWHVSPHWMQELQSNIAAAALPGSLSDPRPVTSIIDLQTVTSTFWKDPRGYNTSSYVICGALLVPWALATLVLRPSTARAWLALASISALSLLPTYHRQYDAALLLLSIPACAILWAEGGPTRWFAVLVNSMCIVMTSYVGLRVIAKLARTLQLPPTGFFGKTLIVVLTRPAPLSVLVLSVFYLCAYARHGRPEASKKEYGNLPLTLVASTLSESAAT